MVPILSLTLRVAKGIRSRMRNWWFRCLGMRIDGYTSLRSIDVPREHHRIHLSKAVALDSHVSIICTEGPNSNPYIVGIGERTYINRHTIIDASQSVRIGQDCMIGPFCYVTDHDHQMDGDRAPSETGLTENPTAIGDRVWIGAHVTVLKGVTIGNNTVVGAGSVVTKDLPAGVLAVGTPAKVIRQLDHPNCPSFTVALEA